jgi:hypothetical protein
MNDWPKMEESRISVSRDKSTFAGNNMSGILIAAFPKLWRQPSETGEFFD